MTMNIYNLFNLHQTANSLEILNRCSEYLSAWDLESVLIKLNQITSTLQATVNIKRLYDEGEQYLKISARILLNPESRQLYDAYLDTIEHPTIEKIKLTQARILWYNSNNNSVHFSKTLLDHLGKTAFCSQENNTEPLPKRQKSTHSTNPICRQCRSDFDFNQDYLVLHCDCTTRTGHTDCMNSFKDRVKGKCPVCRKTLLVRYQISKYLFWQNKEKFKLIT